MKAEYYDVRYSYADSNYTSNTLRTFRPPGAEEEDEEEDTQRSFHTGVFKTPIANKENDVRLSVGSLIQEGKFKRRMRTAILVSLLIVVLLGAGFGFIASSAENPANQSEQEETSPEISESPTSTRQEPEENPEPNIDNNGETLVPTKLPTRIPTLLPTENPTELPTSRPTWEPTGNPTKSATEAPTIFDWDFNGISFSEELAQNFVFLTSPQQDFLVASDSAVTSFTAETDNTLSKLTTVSCQGQKPSKQCRAGVLHQGITDGCSIEECLPLQRLTFDGIRISLGEGSELDGFLGSCIDKSTSACLFGVGDRNPEKAVLVEFIVEGDELVLADSLRFRVVDSNSCP